MNNRMHPQDLRAIVAVRRDFFSRVTYAHGPNGCWIWNGYRDGEGYGRFFYRGAKVRAHRLSWEIVNSTDFPKGFMGVHSCDNPACVNPGHVSPGSASQNISEAYGRGLMPKHGGSKKGSVVTESCRRGHLWDVYGVKYGGKWHCKACDHINYINRKGTR